jgi:hypothetical protein
MHMRAQEKKGFRKLLGSLPDSVYAETFHIPRGTIDVSTFRPELEESGAVCAIVSRRHKHQTMVRGDCGVVGTQCGRCFCNELAKDHSDSFVWRTEVNAPKCSDPFYIKASCTSNNFVTSPLLLDHCAAVEKHHTFIVSCDLAVLAYTACHVGSSFPIQGL